MTELKHITDDTEELKHAIGALKLRMYLGCNNICPKCKRRGNFGSIAKFKCDKTDNWYLLCGWCGEITKTNLFGIH